MSRTHLSMRHRMRSRGSALLLAMLILALFTLGVGRALSDNQWQLRLTASATSEDRALQAADSALEWAEHWLLSRPQRPLPCAGTTCSPTAVVRQPGAVPWTATSLNETWWLSEAAVDGWDPDQSLLLSDRGIHGTPSGRWLVEELAFEPADPGSGRPDLSWYRIIARGARAPRGSAVLVESILARPWGDPLWVDPLPATVDRFCTDPTIPRPCGRTAWRREQ